MIATLERSRPRDAPTGGKAEAILAAAKRAFLAGGYGAVSMDAIAREAGVSKATVYAHFAGKEELFGAVIARQCETYFGGFSAGELDPHDVRASLIAWGRRFLELILSPDGLALHRIIIAEAPRFPALGDVFWRAGPERERSQIEGFLRSAAAAGSLAVDDPRLAAEQFLGLVRGDIQLQRLLCLDAATGRRAIRDAVAAAVDRMMRAYAVRDAAG